MGTAVRSPLGPRTVKMPWGLSLFLLAIFAFAVPFNPSNSGNLLEVGLDEASQANEKKSEQRQIALLCLGLFAALALSSKKRSRLRVSGLLGWSVLFFLFLALASPAWAEDSSLAIRRVGILVLLCLGALAVAARLSQIQTAALAVCVCSFTLIVSLAVELASGTFRPLDGSWRFAGVVHPVTQGWNCGLLAIASLAMAAVSPRRRNRFIVLAAVAVLFLVLTRTRMALASTILASAVCASLVSPKARRLTLVSAYLLLCGSLVWVFRGGDLGGTTISISTLGRGEEAASSLSTLTGRVTLWNALLDYERARPILGYGYNTFLTPRNLAAVSEGAGWVPASAHSGYIGTLLELGCLGAAAFVLVLALSLKRSLSLARNGPSAAFAAAVMIWLCCNLFLESGLIRDPAFTTFISMVILASLAFKENVSHASGRLVTSRRLLTRIRLPLRLPQPRGPIRLAIVQHVACKTNQHQE